MKTYKCDRCGKRYDAIYDCCGIETRYYGRVEVYSYSDVPTREMIDLCQDCQGEIDKFVRKFMASRD